LENQIFEINFMNPRGVTMLMPSNRFSANTAQSRRAFFHKRRQKPLVVRVASQTLLSRMTRTRQGEGFFFGQADFSRQVIKRGKQPVQFAFGGKEILKHLFRLLVGKLPDFINHFASLHG